MPSFTNTKDAQAYRGQSVIFSSDFIPNIEDWKNLLGKKVKILGTEVYGICSEVDVYGISLKITPIQPNLRFDSPASSGILLAGSSISFV